MSARSSWMGRVCILIPDKHTPLMKHFLNVLRARIQDKRECFVSGCINPERILECLNKQTNYAVATPVYRQETITGHTFSYNYDYSL